MIAKMGTAPSLLAHQCGVRIGSAHPHVGDTLVRTVRLAIGWAPQPCDPVPASLLDLRSRLSSDRLRLMREELSQMGLHSLLSLDVKARQHGIVVWHRRMASSSALASTWVPSK